MLDRSLRALTAGPRSVAGPEVYPPTVVVGDRLSSVWKHDPNPVVSRSRRERSAPTRACTAAESDVPYAGP